MRLNMKTEERIHSLLEDRSFPSMILLDGNWGVGKTHFVKYSLKPYLETKYSKPFKTIYLSLYGVTSLEDFKDRLLSLAYTGNKKSNWFAEKYSNLTGSSVQIFEGTRGVGAALGSVASIVKYHYFNKLNNLVLFLDDLERVSSETVKSEILGECLNLAENKNIKILVVANRDKIERELKDDIEKVFSDIVHFNRTPSDLVSVLDKIYTGYKALSDSQKQSIKGLLEEYKLHNLRIIRRSIDRYNSISNLFERYSGLDYTSVDNRHFIASFSVCTAIYQHGYSLDEVIKTFNENPYIQHQTEGETEEDKRTDLLRSLIHPIRHNATENLIKFIATYENNFKDIAQELSLPLAVNRIQEILDYKFRKDDDEWLLERLPDFKAYIENPEPTDLVNWMRACNVFAFLIKNNYVSDNLESFKAQVQDTLPSFTFTTLEDIEELNRDLRFHVHDENFKELFSSFLNNARESNKNERVDSFRIGFLKSWSTVTDIAHNQYHMTPFLNFFNRSDFEQALNSWANEDVDDFDSYVGSRYNFNNIDDYFAAELEALGEFMKAISSIKTSLPVGAKLGVISELERKLDSIYSRLAEKVEANLQTTE